MVTLLASWNNQDDGEGNEKLKKKHATVLTDKQKKTWTGSAHFEKNSPCHCRWSNVVKLYRKGNTIFAATFKASSTRISIIFNPQIFFRDSKISTSTCIRIQIEFARPQVSGFTLSQLAKRSSALAKMLSPIFFSNCFTEKIVPSSTFSFV